MNAGPGAFHNTPVTKGLVLSCGLASVLVGTQGGVRVVSLSYQKVVQKLQLWRLITAPFIFSSTPELLFGLYLLYFFRVFERQIGSNKYMFFVLFSTAITSMMEVVALAAMRDPNSSTGFFMTPGPFGLIFASFVPFFFDMPISIRFKVFGVRFSDKSFVYLAGLQLLFASWTFSFIPGICGLLAGFVYRSNLWGVKRIKFPEGLATLAVRVSSPLMSGLSTPSTMTRFAATAPPLHASPPPSEEAISTLVAMGFDQEDALQALTIARNDMTTATNLLLESQSH